MNYNAKNKLPIQEFDLSNLRTQSEPGKGMSIVIIAPTGSGKSWVVRAILNEIKDYPVGIIISRTEHIDRFYSDFCPETYIYDNYTPSIIKKVFRRQAIVLAKAKKYKERGKELDTRCFIVMDDCFADSKSWTKDTEIKTLLYEGRHYNITYILTMQYPLGIAPDLRSQFKYIFVLANDKFNDQKKIYDHYAGIFPSFFAFREIYMQLTEDHGCLVVKTGNSKTPLEKIFHYKAPDLSSSHFIVGGKQYKKYHKVNYKKDWDTVQEKFDVVDFCNEHKRSKEHIKIHYEK
jgi:hypothetical protein